MKQFKPEETSFGVVMDETEIKEEKVGVKSKNAQNISVEADGSIASFEDGGERHFVTPPSGHKFSKIEASKGNLSFGLEKL